LVEGFESYGLDKILVEEEEEKEENWQKQYVSPLKGRHNNVTDNILPCGTSISQISHFLLLTFLLLAKKFLRWKKFALPPLLNCFLRACMDTISSFFHMFRDMYIISISRQVFVIFDITW
jgi:hypothetical protein